ncbi:hypothetical protein [Bradyrhizobium sp. STM 3843]|uniref:hypothetical protein n=1 Tax=Bradyrhizobium sp. STM 3843 TaxID=551947 RepID=UPI000560A746|nr:hypothetical protein [Bradyrhizobium sp. STM 3843]
MNCYMLYVPKNGVEAMNAIRDFSEVGLVTFELFTIRTERSAREIVAAIAPTLGDNPQYILAQVDGVGYQGGSQLAGAARFLRTDPPDPTRR